MRRRVLRSVKDLNGKLRPTSRLEHACPRIHLDRDRRGDPQEDQLSNNFESAPLAPALELLAEPWDNLLDGPVIDQLALVNPDCSVTHPLYGASGKIGRASRRERVHETRDPP